MRGLMGTFAEMARLFEPADRRLWPLLLGSSVTGGVARALALAAVNEAVAAYGRGQPYLTHAWVVAALVVVALLCGHFSTVQGLAVGARTEIRLRQRLLRGVLATDLRLLERTGADGVYWQLMWNVSALTRAYSALLVFGGAVAMLTLNFAYVGWLSLPGLGLALLVTLAGVGVHLLQERRNLVPKRARDAAWTESWERHREFIDGYKELKLARAKAQDYEALLQAIGDRIQATWQVEARNSSAARQSTFAFQMVLIGGMAFALPALTGASAVTVLQLVAALVVAIGPVEAAVGAFPDLAQARVALEKYRAFEADMQRAGQDPSALATPEALRLGEPWLGVALREVCFDFDAAGDAEAFRLGPVSLDLRAGEVLFVSGGNGSGKTVLLKLLCGLYRPTSGTVLLNGRAVGDAERQRLREQFVPVLNDSHLFAELLGLGLVDDAAVNALIAHYGLEGKTRCVGGVFSTRDLSAGQRKRLALVVARLDPRPVLLLDEFGAEQDPEHRRQFYTEWLPELRALGKTVVLVTHDDAYFDRCDRLLRMDFGRIVAERRPQAPSAGQGDANAGGATA